MHTKELISLEFHDQNKTLCYEYKKAMSLGKVTFDMLPFDLGGIHLQLQARVPHQNAWETGKGLDLRKIGLMH
jgi:hypothetical protein